jgi:hypothetical protein
MSGQVETFDCRYCTYRYQCEVLYGEDGGRVCLRKERNKNEKPKEEKV